mmetsp:Transcript_9533/g.15821  ORF Transcript_9533/g.15821 Transcript_9533/m.15821 type:complete len:259 (-) Transcript_9533:440-1216(-)
MSAHASRKIRLVDGPTETQFGAAECKDRGNRCFKRNDWEGAEEWYTFAIDLSPVDATLYANRSAAFAKRLQWESAIDDALFAADLAPAWVKAHVRCAQAYSGHGKHEAAFLAYQFAHDLEPTNSTILEALENSSRKLHRTTLPGGTMRSSGGPVKQAVLFVARRSLLAALQVRATGLRAVYPLYCAHVRKPFLRLAWTITCHWPRLKLHAQRASGRLLRLPERRDSLGSLSRLAWATTCGAMGGGFVYTVMRKLQSGR